MKSTYPDRGNPPAPHPTSSQSAAAAQCVRRRADAERWPEGPDPVLDMLGLTERSNP